MSKKPAKRTSKKTVQPISEKSDKKKNTSLRLDKHTLKALKIKAIEQDTSVQNLIESLINDYLANSD